MGSRKRSDSGTFVETVSLKDVLGVFEEVPGPVITSSDAAEQLECTTGTARKKLQQLCDQGVVDKRKTAGVLLWWDTGENRLMVDDRSPMQVVDDILSGWEPGTGHDELARAETRRAVAYLREDGGGLTASDFKDALAEDCRLVKHSWWSDVREGFKQLAEWGLIEYDRGYSEYRWVADDGRSEDD